MKKTQLTKQGYEDLRTELNQLVEAKRPKLVERLSFARSQGDLSENNDYQSARDELEFLDGRIAELQEIIDTASVVEEKKANGEVAMGNCVTVKVNGTQTEFNIVGDWEADPRSKKISHISPLGQALVGKKKGDKVEVEAPAGKVVYEIVSIE